MSNKTSRKQSNITLHEMKQNKTSQRQTETIDNRTKPMGTPDTGISDTNCKATVLIMFEEIKVYFENLSNEPETVKEISEI